MELEQFPPWRRRCGKGRPAGTRCGCGGGSGCVDGPVECCGGSDECPWASHSAQAATTGRVVERPGKGAGKRTSASARRASADSPTPPMPTKCSAASAVGAEVGRRRESSTEAEATEEEATSSAEPRARSCSWSRTADTASSPRAANWKRRLPSRHSAPPRQSAAGRSHTGA
jgi:hypothetical protein